MAENLENRKNDVIESWKIDSKDVNLDETLNLIKKLDWSIEGKEPLDNRYLDQKFRALFNEIARNEKQDYFTAEMLDDGRFCISTDSYDFLYDSNIHECWIANYPKWRPNFKKKTIFNRTNYNEKEVKEHPVEHIAITSKEHFNQVESSIRNSFQSKIDEADAKTWEKLSGIKW